MSVAVRHPLQPLDADEIRRARDLVLAMLKPYGLFDRNPTLDVPPPAAAHACHA